MRSLASVAIVTAIVGGASASDLKELARQNKPAPRSYLLDDGLVEKTLFPTQALTRWVLAQVGIEPRPDYSRAIGIQTPAIDTRDLDIPNRRPRRLFDR
jgi:hypothetical protein